MDEWTRYALKRRFYADARKRRGVSVAECAAAMGVSTSTWHRRASQAARDDSSAHHWCMRSLELAHTPLQNAAGNSHREQG